MISRWFGMVSLLIAAWSSTAFAGDGVSLQKSMEELYNLPLDTASTLEVRNLVITHEDMTLRIDSGRLAFYAPADVDSSKLVCGAYAEGNISFSFSPSPDWEKGQLKRFYKDDSVQFVAKEVVLFFTDAIRAQLLAAGTPAAVTFNASSYKKGKKLLDRLEHYDEDRSFRFEVLQALLHPANRPFLLLAIDPSVDDRLFYKFNPLRREEIEFYKNFRQPGSDFMELVCEYSQHTLKPEIGINGLSKTRLNITHYDLDGFINTQGRYFGSARMNIRADSCVRVVPFALHYELQVDSVKDGLGKQIAFGRYKDDYDWHYPLYLFFDTMVPAGADLDVTVFYNGEIAKRELGEFFVSASNDWYPRYGWRQVATFDMSFKTSKRFAFVSTGEKGEEHTVAETLFTTWKISEPTSNASFAIGNMKKYEFTDTLIGAVDIYKNTELESTGRKMEKQVSEDIINAARLFEYRFGDCPYERLSVTEILSYGGEAFPGFLHLGIETFDRTDEYGEQRSLRAHEVAHQWWGVGAGAETYHDSWLSEGFAEYSALMYLQAVEGNDMFLDKLKGIRKEICGLRNYIFASGAEAGPIILGYRTSSTKTGGDYGLIIYQKGALVLHMLRNMMIDLRTFKEDRFFAMMKDYYETYRGTTATTADFRAIVEKHIGEDMGWFFDQWIYGTESPTIDFTYTIEPDEGNTFTAKCKMVTKDVREDFVTYIPVEIQIDDKTKAYLRVVLDKPVTEFTLPKLPRKPKAIKLNPFESVLAEVNQ